LAGTQKPALLVLLLDEVLLLEPGVKFFPYRMGVGVITDVGTLAPEVDHLGAARPLRRFLKGDRIHVLRCLVQPPCDEYLLTQNRLPRPGWRGVVMPGVRPGLLALVELLLSGQLRTPVGRDGQRPGLITL